MTSWTASTAAQAEPNFATACGDCGAVASGNFCSACGADLRADASGLFGAVSSGVRQSFPATYLRILKSPVCQTVRLTEDPTYRQHGSFLLAGIAIFSALFIPILIQAGTANADMSPSLQVLVKILAQVGVYVGALITFLLGFSLFRYFAKERRTFSSYFKLYCLAFGFIMPLYAVYEFVVRRIFGGTGISSFENMPAEQSLSVSAIASVVLALLLWAYFVAIHRRFWKMPLYKAATLYIVAALTSYYASYWLMFYVGFWTASTLISMGIVVA